ncbi:hypothetical protein PENTCL1PPCAC_16587, partial [Pristionchus entomophagus]
MQFVSSRYLLPPFITALPAPLHEPKSEENMPDVIGELPEEEKELPMAVEHVDTTMNIEEPISNVPSDSTEEDCKIDRLFYRICNFCLLLGVNFDRTRCTHKRCLSLIIMT